MAMINRRVKAIIQFRRATESEWIEKNPILRPGEPALSIDKGLIKMMEESTDEQMRKSISEVLNRM